MNEPRRYRKKPVVIEAVRFETSEIVAWLQEHDVDYDLIFNDQNNRVDAIEITTLEGVMTAKLGDWIIRGVQGEFYPVKDSIFQETYEEAGDAE